MKILFYFLTFLLFTYAVNAQQSFHLNLFVGASNYQGDLQDKRFTFSQSHLAGGVGVSYDLTEHVALRGGLILGTVSGDDQQGKNKIRNLNFTSGLSEVHIGAEYYITPLHQHLLTPYVFAGLALYHFNPYTDDMSGIKYYLKPLSTEGEGFIAGKKNYSLTQGSIPFGGGVKLTLDDKISVGIEIGFRKLFTDYLDDVSDVYVDKNLLLSNRGAKAVELAYRGDEINGSLVYPTGGKRGSPKAKDWYYLTGLTLSYKLGAGNGKGDKSQLSCPKNVL